MEKYNFRFLLEARETNAQLDRIFNVCVYMVLIEHRNHKAVTEALYDSDPVFTYDAKSLHVGMSEADTKKFKQAYIYHNSPEIQN